MDFNKIFQSRAFKGISCGVLAFIILLVVFSAGLAVGFKKANFSYKWGENYHQNFAGPRGGFFQEMGMMGGREFIDAHGLFGSIIKVDGATIVMKDKDGVEKIISLNDKTAIERFRDSLKPSDLKVDDQIIVIGEPNESGQIEAKLIRVMPAPPATDNLPLPNLPTPNIEDNQGN